MGLANIRRKEARLKRKKSIRKRLSGSTERPRLTVFRSIKHIYAQIIDDTSGNTLVSASSLEPAANEKSETENRKDMAQRVGTIVGKRAIEKGIQRVVFDRNGFLYHGRVKALSDGARKAGLDF